MPIIYKIFHIICTLCIHLARGLAWEFCWPMMWALVGSVSFLNGMGLVLHSRSRIFELMLQMLLKTFQLGVEKTYTVKVVHPSFLSNGATEVFCASGPNKWCPVCLNRKQSLIFTVDSNWKYDVCLKKEKKMSVFTYTVVSFFFLVLWPAAGDSPSGRDPRLSYNSLLRPQADQHRPVPLGMTRARAELRSPHLLRFNTQHLITIPHNVQTRSIRQRQFASLYSDPGRS